MKSNKAYIKLSEIQKEISLLSSIEELLAWDNRTYMPVKAAEHRSEQISYMAGKVHEKRTDPRIGDLLSELETSGEGAGELSPEAVNVREWRKHYDKLTKLPREHVEEKSRTTIRSESAWIEAKKKADFKILEPWLIKTIDLNIQTADYLGYDDEAYDALLDIYEPGMKTAEVAAIFKSLRVELVDLLEKIKSAPKSPDRSIFKRKFPKTLQSQFVREIVETLGYRFSEGSLDETAHPFCIGMGPNDIRITTHFSEDYLPGALFGVIHEAGHGIYEQNLPKEHWGTPAGEFVSLGIHESQSRMWENIVGRSHAFWEKWFPRAQQMFTALDGVTLDDFVFAVNNVEPSFIRIEADEVTYNLHIMIRFEIERALIKREVKASDIPGMWNEKFREYFGIDVPGDDVGCLQDIHWAEGMIGYFPTYTLGNLNAAQLYRKAGEEIDNLEAKIAAGDYAPLREWLTAKVHSQGKRYSSADLIKEATGQPLQSVAMMEYLESKYFGLYGF